MRKKTINFYFYKRIIINPGTSTVFCFSNRAFRYNRHLQKYRSSKRKTPKTFYFYNFLITNKQRRIFITNRIKYNLWLLTKFNLKRYFITSFFLTKSNFSKLKWHHKNIYLQLKLWFYYKVKANLASKKRIRKYPAIGGLSYQISRALSRKNLSYQVISKYRPKLFNMNLHNNHFYATTKQVSVYYSFLLFSLFAFSADPSKSLTYYDDQFTITRTTLLNTNIYTNNKTYKQFLTFNCSYIKAPIDITDETENLLFLYKNSHIFTEDTITLDLLKQTELKSLLNWKNSQVPFIILYQFFIGSIVNLDLSQQPHIFLFLQKYARFYP